MIPSVCFSASELLPCLDRGLTSERTYWFAFSSLTVFWTAVWLAPEVSLPVVASTTIGTEPLACEGSFCSSRSVAAVESEPGIVVSSEVGRPVAVAPSEIPIAIRIQSAKTTFAWRAQKPPRR